MVNRNKYLFVTCVAVVFVAMICGVVVPQDSDDSSADVNFTVN